MNEKDRREYASYSQDSKPRCCDRMPEELLLLKFQQIYLKATGFEKICSEKIGNKEWKTQEENTKMPKQKDWQFFN